MCKDKHWEGINDEMFETRVNYKHPCCKHMLFIYRLISFIFLLQTIIHFQIYVGAHWYTQLAFMTIWGVIFTSVTFGGLLCLNSLECRKNKCHKCCPRFIHQMYNLSLSLGVLIFIIFWGALLPFLLQQNLSALAYWFQIELHFFTQLLIVIDFILCGIHFHKWHYFVVLGVGVAYLIVNAVVTLSAFRVYPILTWKDGMTALWLIVSFGLATGAFFLFWWLGRKKQRSKQKHVAESKNAAMQERLIQRPEEEQAVQQSLRGSHVI